MLLAGVIALWFVLVIVLGFVVGDERGRNIATRLGEAVRGEGTVEETNLALVRGWLAVDRLAVRRDDEVGKLSLDIGELRCELPPLGFAIFDRECRELALSGLALEVSTFEVLRVQRPKRPPIRTRSVLIEDAKVVVPSENGRVEVRLAFATADATTFKTPLSFIFQLRELRATVVSPLGTVEVAYMHGLLVAWGGFLTKPIVIALPLPEQNLDDDPKAELARIVGWGRALVKSVVKQQLKSLFR